MENRISDDFYSDLEKGNAVMHQQAKNNIMLAATSKITESIMNGDSIDKVNGLMDILKGLKEGD